MAEFQVAAVFSDHMVLQREKTIAVFGEGEDGARVTVTLSGGEKDVTAEAVTANGCWSVMMPAQKAGNDYSMTVCCGSHVRKYTDIAVGEVWLAGGQSNMELELQNAYEGARAIDEDGALNGGSGPNVRFYYTQKISYMDEHFFEQEKKTCWGCFGDGSEKYWSAVGYFFAKKLAKDLGVTVGVIGCNWGGTSASAWIDRESLLEDGDLRSYVDEYEAAIAGKSVEEQIREYDDYEAYHEVWSKKAEELAKTDPMLPWEEVLARCGVCKWPGPMNCKNPFRPSGLYECMLQRVAPYTLRGVIWYQGESDDHKPNMYEKLFTKMIGVWRRDWQDDSMPFLFVQLPMHRYQQDADFKNWPVIREAQEHVCHTVKHTGMAVIAEFSEWSEIHPRRKREAGERLVKQAEFHVYHSLAARDAFGPMYGGHVVHDAREGEKCGNIELMFRYAEDGFYVTDGPFVEKEYRADGTVVLPPERKESKGSIESASKESASVESKESTAFHEPAEGSTEARERVDAPDLTAEELLSDGFEIAGGDRKFVPAQYEVVKDRIFVWSKEVEEPKYVRYLWTNYRIPHIFGRHTGIPLAPFRTDPGDEIRDTPMESAKVQQVMEL